ncbi:MAG: putative glutamine amidotransferase [Solirubrobacterales bacterium]|jgi:putative glutamine amidotransferase|nr:putative glutamine amidotransferase [Solirubrobacterales bacterium]
MGRPVIGISSMIERAAWTVWEDVEVNVSQRSYSEGIDRTGGLPLLLPPSEAGTAEPGAILDRLDGLLLAGGADLDPATYGADADPTTTNSRAERDRFEVALARAALERELPLLGICRGMQLLNVACGGTLVQHLPDAELHLHTPGQFSDHGVRLEPGSLAARVVGSQRVSVRSHHHQGIDRLGDGLRATGWADPGEAIEAIEAPDRRWALGILWHAEEDPSTQVLAELTAAARQVTA